MSAPNRTPVARGFRRLFRLKSAGKHIDALGLVSDSSSIISEKVSSTPVVSIIKRARRSFSKATRVTEPHQLDEPTIRVDGSVLSPPEAKATPKAIVSVCRNILQLPVEIVCMVGQILCLEDRIILSLGCKALQAIFGAARKKDFSGPVKQIVLERLERDLSRTYTYCPTCNILHPNIRNHEERYIDPESVGNTGCEGGEYRPNHTWKEGSTFLSYQDARMLGNYRRYGPGSGMSPAEFNHATGWNQRDAFYWNSYLEVKFVRGSDHLMLRSTVYILGPEKEPMLPARVPLVHRHFLCEHAGMFDLVDGVPTLGMFRNGAANLTRNGFETPIGCGKCHTDWGFEVLDMEEAEDGAAAEDSAKNENLDSKPILAISQTYHLMQDVYNDYEWLWGDLFSHDHENITPDSSTLAFSDFAYAYEYAPGTLPAVWVQGCDS